MTIPEQDCAVRRVSVVSKEDLEFINKAMFARGLITTPSWLDIDTGGVVDSSYIHSQFIANVRRSSVYSDALMCRLLYINRRFVPPSDPVEIPDGIHEAIEFPGRYWPECKLPAYSTPANPTLKGMPLDPDILRRIYYDLREKKITFRKDFYRPATSDTYGGLYGKTTTTFSYYEKIHKQPTFDDEIITGRGGGPITTPRSKNEDETFTITYSDGTYEESQVNTEYLVRKNHKSEWPGSYCKRVQTQDFIDFYFRPYLSSVTAVIPVEIEYYGEDGSLHGEAYAFAIPLAEKENDFHPTAVFASKWRMTNPFSESFMRSFLESKGAEIPVDDGIDGRPQRVHFTAYYDRPCFIAPIGSTYSIPDGWPYTPS